MHLYTAKKNVKRDIFVSIEIEINQYKKVNLDKNVLFTVNSAGSKNGTLPQGILSIILKCYYSICLTPNEGR